MQLGFSLFSSNELSQCVVSSPLLEIVLEMLYLAPFYTLYLHNTIKHKINYVILRHKTCIKD